MPDETDDYGRKAQPSERDLGPSAFLPDFQRAVRDYKVAALDCDFDPKSEAVLRAGLEKSHALLLGEVHGVEQTPNIIYTLFKKFGFRHLALEGADDMNDWADKFTSGKGDALDFGGIHDTCGGGIMPGHLAVIQQLKKEGLLDKLTFFHPTIRFEDDDNESRDRLMAEKLQSRLSDAPTLVITGSHHATREHSPGLPGGAEYPMGYHLKQTTPGIQAGRIDALSGQFFGMYGDARITGAGDFTDRSSQSPDGKPRFLYNEQKDSFVLELPKALPARALRYYTETWPETPARSAALEGSGQKSPERALQNNNKP